MMKRRGFLINTTVILLLIPLLLLLATYENASSYIISSQGERVQAERTFDVVSYVSQDFQRAMAIIGKKAIISAVDYVATTGKFIDPTVGANNTIKHLMTGESDVLWSNPDVQRLMKNQNLPAWISNVSKLLRAQGYLLEPSPGEIVNRTEITVAPLDSFHIVIKARIMNVTIKDISGKVVYTGPIPRSGYAYSIISIQQLEDPYYAVMSGGRYHRSVRACSYAFPAFTPPFTVANGSGTGNTVAGVFGKDFQYNSTAIWDSQGDSITNLTINGLPVTTDKVVLKDGDMGLMRLGNASPITVTTPGWCSVLGYRINLTIQNNLAQNLVNFQVPIYIDSLHVSNLTLLDTFFKTADSDGDNIPIIKIYYNNCTPVNFWVEKWDTTAEKAIIWVNVTIPAGSEITLGIYFDSSGTETLGNPNKVFDFYDDFSGTSLNTTKWISNTNQYEVLNGYIKMWGNWNNRYYINTLKSFEPNVIIEGVWRLGGYYYYDTDLTIGLVPTSTTRWLSNSAIYAWYDGYGGTRPYNRKTLRIYGTYPVTGSPIYSTNWQSFEIVYTGTQIGFWDSYTYSWLIAAVSPSLSLFHLQIAADTDSTKRFGYIDWIRVRKYASTPPTVSISNQLEQKPVSTIQPISARVLDIQPFVNCIQDERYFGIYGGMSFFERLEGSRQNHDAYVRLAHEMQDELGYKYRGQYYPIGLVSFLIPNAVYDEKLTQLFNELGIQTDNTSSADYYFLPHYFQGETTESGYRVWGISYGVTSLGDLSQIPFYLDPSTAEAVFGSIYYRDLLYGYSG
ncbi:DUF2341 domain-containing protein [Thermococcus sp.]